MTSPIHTEPLITLDQIAIMLRGRVLLPDTSWKIYPQQNWVILGPNGAGKSSICKALIGQVPICRGRMNRASELWAPHKIAYVSFETQRKLFRSEDKLDASRCYRGVVDEETSVEESIQTLVEEFPEHNNLDEIADLLNIRHLLKQGIRTLSNGETRKFILARALMKNPRLLILDEPFDGMDIASREAFKLLIGKLINPNLQVILITHRIEEIPSNFSHVLCLKDGKVFSQGPKEILTKNHVSSLYGLSNIKEIPFAHKTTSTPQSGSAPLIHMKNINVRYGSKIVLDHLNWTMNGGENWTIIGPNGAGKSTLIRLISGNHLQAYSNEIYLFGRRRGTGESIWEIKKKIGLVSAETQVGYDSDVSVFKVILSGYYDSIGLFQNSTPEQRKMADEWLDKLLITDKKNRPFNQISQGEQRLVLIARAMVKSPRLLIADEPCQGLDYANRKKVLKLIDTIGKQTSTSVIYITHHQEEQLSSITNMLRFIPNDKGTYDAEITSIT